jgi:predicted phage-related endonuclease
MWYCIYYRNNNRKERRMTETHVDMQAALAEGLAPMPAHLIPLRDESNDLKEQIDKLTERRDKIKEIFGKTLVAEGHQGFLLNGKVHARVSNVTNNRVDTKALREKRPDVFQEFLVTTKSQRIVVN